MPNRGVLSITAYKYLDTDIGPYNEVSLAVPVTIDNPTPVFTGSPDTAFVLMHRVF